MKTIRHNIGFPHKVMALAVLAAFAPAHAAEGDALAQLTNPNRSSVAVGIGTASGDSQDRAIFGQYNGYRENGTRLLLDFDYLRRDAETGTWTILTGQNLGLDTREIRAVREKQGDWRFSGEYSELARVNPRTVNTALQAPESTAPTVVRLATPGSGADLDLRTKRKAVTLAGSKWITPSLQFELNFKNEDKDGARLFGRGYDCANLVCTGVPSATLQKTAFLLTPEPINSTIRQLDAKLNYSADKFFLSAGYYGSFYTNENGSLTPRVPNVLNNGNFTALGSATLFPAAPGGMSLQNVLQSPLALPPDNQAHQFYLSGNYAFSPTTKLNFKYAYTRASQDDDFAGQGLGGAPAGRTNLDGLLVTSLAQVGLTSRPMPKLALQANVRYENRDDQTPVDYYNFNGTTRWTNGHQSLRKLNGKLEGTYRLTDAYSATLGADYESIDRGMLLPTVQVTGINALRQETNETGYRMELRRSMSETLNGSLAYIHSRRDGSNWLLLNGGALTGIRGEVTDNSVFASTGLATLGRYLDTFPSTLMDRKRDRVRLLLDWSPTERLSFQLVAENGKDDYSAPTEKGMQDIRNRLVSLDASFALTDAWKLNGYLSRGVQTIHQARTVDYVGELDNISTAFGLGLAGKASAKLDVGANFAIAKDSNRFGLGPDPASPAATRAQLAFGLPDISFRQNSVSLFAKYALAKNSDLRFNLVHQRVSFDDWTYGYNGVPVVYSDGTTVNMKQDQSVTFLGVSYLYKF